VPNSIGNVPFQGPILKRLPEPRIVWGLRAFVGTLRQLSVLGRVGRMVNKFGWPGGTCRPPMGGTAIPGGARHCPTGCYIIETVRVPLKYGCRFDGVGCRPNRTVDRKPLLSREPGLDQLGSKKVHLGVIIGPEQENDQKAASTIEIRSVQIEQVLLHDCVANKEQDRDDGGAVPHIAP
jgi:hypothetical protein